MDATTAHDVWKILQDAYRGSEKVISIKLQALWKEFDTLSMKEDETIQIFFDGVTNIVNNIRLYGDTIEDKKNCTKNLKESSTKIDHIGVTVEESKDLSKLTVIELTGSLQAHEERLRRFFRPTPRISISLQIEILQQWRQ